MIELTGNRALTGYTAPKLLWIRRHKPDFYARICHVLLPKDYVRFWLTGEHAIDVTDASDTLLFDVARRRWSDEVLDALELPCEWLPPMNESTEIGQPAIRSPARSGSADDYSEKPRRGFRSDVAVKETVACVAFTANVCSELVARVDGTSTLVSPMRWPGNRLTRRFPG